MFDNDRYVTKGVNEGVGFDIQLAICSILDSLREKKDFTVDYLQVFELRVVKNSNAFNLEITHSQEVPPFKKEYLISVRNPVDTKIYFIDNGSYSTMLLAEEEY